MISLLFTASMAFAGVYPTPTPTCWYVPENERVLECSETRVVWEMPRSGLDPPNLRMVILEPQGGTGIRHVWDDVTGHPTAYPVQNHTPVSILTPWVRVHYPNWLATVTAEARPKKKRATPTPAPTMTEDELHFVLGIQAYNEGRYDNAKVLLEHVADKGPKFAVAKDLLELIQQRGEPQARQDAPWICYHKWVLSPTNAVVMVDDDPGMSKRYGFMSSMHAHGLCLREKEGDDYARGSVGNFYGVGWVEAMVVPLEHCLKCGVLRVRPADRKTVGLTEDQRDAILKPTMVARQRK